MENKTIDLLESLQLLDISQVHLMMQGIDIEKPGFSTIIFQTKKALELLILNSSCTQYKQLMMEKNNPNFLSE